MNLCKCDPVDFDGKLEQVVLNIVTEWKALSHKPPLSVTKTNDFILS